MAHEKSQHQIGNASSGVLASVPVNDATARQNEAEKDSQGKPLLPPHVQGAGLQPERAPYLDRLCHNCGSQEEDWTRSVVFASSANDGSQFSITGMALFDTGANLNNLLSLDFVTAHNIHFKRYTNAKKTRLPVWKRIWSRVTGKHSQAARYTVDQRPITAIGVVENLRWRGISEPRCNSGLHFPQRFLSGDFLVVENLAYDAIFCSKTMNDAGLRGTCHRTVAVIQPPKPTKDPAAVKKYEAQKKEQKKLQEILEKEKRDDTGKSKTPSK